MLGKYLNEYFGKGSRTRRDGAAVSGDVRKAIGRNTSILWLLLNRCKRLGGKRCKELAGCRTEVLDDGTQVKTCLNPFGLRPIFSSFVSAPPKLIPESIVEFVRGLIGIPLSDECNDGFLATTWPGDGTQIQLPPNCSLSWNYCTASVDENQPRRHAFASAKTPSQLETGETLGQLADVQRSPDYGTWGAYIDQQGPEYGKMDWISANVGTVDNPDFIVLSWKTFAARYASLPPEAKDLFYRGDVLCSLPVVTAPNQTALTFLGAAVADFAEDLPYAAGAYLIAAVLVEKLGGTIPGKTVENWVYKWLAERPHDCPGQEIPPHTGHHPVQFYVRPWRASYQNDDLYDSFTNPNGWRHLGEVLCQNFNPSTYARVFVRPRVLAGVQFQPEGNGSSIKACWSCVDEWVNTTDNESVWHVTGYQTAEVTLTDVTESSSVLNDEHGVRSEWNGETFASDVSAEWDPGCCGPDPTNEWACPEWQTDFFSQASDNNEYAYIATDVGAFSDYVVAVDWDRDNNLVTASLSLVNDWDGGVVVATCFSEQDTLFQYICDEDEVTPPCVDGSKIRDFNSTQNNKSIDDKSNKWNFVVSGANGFSIPFLTSYVGQRNNRDRTAVKHAEDGKQCTFFNENLVPPDWDEEDPTITSIGSRYTGTTRDATFNVTHAGAGSNYRTAFIMLDLRFGSCLYTKGGYENWTGLSDITTINETETDSQTNHYVANVVRDGAVIEIGVIDKGVASTLAFEVGGINTANVTTNSTTPGPGQTFNGSGRFCYNSPPADTLSQGSTTPADYNFKSREGIPGFFEIDGVKLGGLSWLIEDVRTDWGACDEYGNMLVSKEISILGYDKSGLLTTYDPVNFGLDPYWSYLSNQTVPDYYGIDELTNPRIGEIGLI